MRIGPCPLGICDHGVRDVIPLRELDLFLERLRRKTRDPRAEPRKLLRMIAERARLRPEQVEKLCAYFGLLAKWNKRLNLTALSVDPPTDEAIDRLLVEPAMAIQAVESTDLSLIDLGSGGGSPAVRSSGPRLPSARC